MSNKEWNADQWEAAVLHLLLCRRELEQCERCQQIRAKVEGRGYALPDKEASHEA